MTLKLNFDDPRALQLVLGAADESRQVRRELEAVSGVRLHTRGGEVTLEGDEGGQDLLRRLLLVLYQRAQRGAPIRRADLGRAYGILESQGEAGLAKVFDDQLVQRSGGKERGGIAPRSAAQKAYVDALRTRPLTFGVGPAGTGKTFLAVAMAVRKLLDREVRRIILTRPAIEAGEHLGFLPGTFEEKVSPYLRPIYDALHAMLDPPKVERMVGQGTIEIAPLAYMRGRTLENAFVILDEAQNATRDQLKMFLTRIGTGTTAAVTGDPSQIDLEGNAESGLAHACRILRGVEGVSVCAFSAQDVMRHPLVARIIKAYEQDAESVQSSRSS